MRVLSRKDVQVLLGISEATTYKLLKELGCPLLHIDGNYRIIDEDLINWLRKREKPEWFPVFYLWCWAFTIS